MNPLRWLLAALKQSFKTNLLAGILFVTPVAATIFFLHFLISWVDMILLLLPKEFQPDSFLPFPVPGLGLIALVIALTIIGFFVRNFVGRKLVQLWEWLMSHIPFVNTFYKAVKQMLETILSGPGKDFKRVVLIEYPRKGVYTLAFVTGVATGEIQSKTHRQVVNLFVPTTPNPTSGFYLMVPEEDVIPLEMSVEDAFKVLMSGGILTPVTTRKNTPDAVR